MEQDMFMKKIKKYYKWIILAVTLIVILALSILIYINLFKQGEENRLEGIEEYTVTKKEINLVKENFNKLEGINDIDIYTNYKIIKIYIKLNEDIDFDDVSEVSLESINNFSEENLKFYDVEVFIDSLDEESEIYPKIGYKHKSNSEFTWNR
jgi:hypothetical protein